MEGRVAVGEYRRSGYRFGSGRLHKQNCPEGYSVAEIYEFTGPFAQPEGCQAVDFKA
jgi:hypothetical protein